MNEAKRQMYIVTAPCWKCSEDMKVAMIVEGYIQKGSGSISVSGVEEFSFDELRIAEKHGVIIQQHHSHTMGQSYDASTCGQCNAFVGQHYLLTEYFVPAVSGDYEYILIDSIF